MSVGKSIHHDSAIGHVSGRSQFIDDRMKLKNEVFVGLIGTPVSAGTVKKIHFDDALKVPGVIAAFTAKDLHHNKWGTIVSEQPILVADKIGYIDVKMNKLF